MPICVFVFNNSSQTLERGGATRKFLPRFEKNRKPEWLQEFHSEGHSGFIDKLRVSLKREYLLLKTNETCPNSMELHRFVDKVPVDAFQLHREILVIVYDHSTYPDKPNGFKVDNAASFQCRGPMAIHRLHPQMIPMTLLYCVMI
ncbi:hypothetical protein EVAR_26686_1 [Eumeta japonica]|uniref:Uncharacterized protein n=1 Tax=Eumeta variegata TaxID=151549 RepID=A0A4C1VLT2_EUMVA|nr:hypothetical protein EVAR_26686_1 [Eumeta japonica]